MDLIKSGSYIDIFYTKTYATTKISTVAGYQVVLAALLLLTVNHFIFACSLFCDFVIQDLLVEI